MCTEEKQKVVEEKVKNKKKLFYGPIHDSCGLQYKPLD